MNGSGFMTYPVKFLSHTLGLGLLMTCYSCSEEPKKAAPYNESRELIPDPEGYKKDTFIAPAPQQLMTDECGFNPLIETHQVTPIAEKIYLHKPWSYDEDINMLALLDSLEAKNRPTRAFYFKVVGMTYEHSDGYYSEGLGLSGKNYIEHHTIEFVSYFDNKTCFTETDLETWANIVLLEFRLLADNEPKKTPVDNYTRQLSINCKSCTAEQKQTLQKFSGILHQLWKEYLKDTEEK